MADEEDQETTEAAAGATKAGMVPKDRLDKEIERRRALEQRLESLEDNGKSDVERLTKELERERAAREQNEKALAERDAQIERANKSNLVRDAAAKLNLVDPDAAVAFANLDEITDAGEAKRFAERLAKDKPYLVAQQRDEPNLRQVFGPGGSKPQQPDLSQMTPEQREQVAKRAQGEAVYNEIVKARAAAGKPPIEPAGATAE